MITGAGLILGGLTLMALLTYPLRRWAVICALAGVAVVIALLEISLRWPLDRVTLLWGRTVLLNQPLQGLGYTLAITEAERPVLVMLGVIALSAFVGAWLQTTESSFVPSGLAILALWAGAVIARPPIAGIAGLLIASCLAVFIVHTQHPASIRAAFRQLWWPLIAFLMALIASGQIQEAELHPDDFAYLQTAAWFLSISLLVLLAPTPLHGPAVSLFAHAPPLVAAFLTAGAQTVLLYLTWLIFSRWPWLAEYIELNRLLAAGGLVTLLWGGLGAMTAGRIPRLWAYAALHDWGVLLLGLGLGVPLEWQMATALFVGRALSLLLGAYGLASLQSRVAQAGWDAAQGIARRLPWTALAITVGGLGLAGFPLTASFGPRWTLIQILLRTRSTWGFLVIIGQLGVALGYLRLLQTFMAPLPRARRLLPREHLATVVLLAAGVLLSGFLALVPQTMDGIVQTVIEIVIQSSNYLP